MSKLIIDVTYLAHWQGRLTGIPRVIDEIAKRYMAGIEMPIFVVWDNMNADFYEVDIGLTIQNRGVSLHYLPTSSKSSKTGLITRRSASALQKLKSSYKAPIPGRFIELVKRRSQKAFKKVNFASNDVLLIPMGEWHNQNYIDMITSFKSMGVKLIQISYDVLPLVQPQYSGHSTVSMNNYNRHVIPLCNLVLSISKNTKQDLTSWLQGEGLTVPEIKVFRLGDDFHTDTPIKPSHKVFELSGKYCQYILSVGTIEARKNHALLYYVYKLAKSRGIVLPTLVVVGRKGWRANDIYELITEDPDTRESIVILTDVSDDELSWLYQNALFSVYPSFYEGWGLPVAESALRGLPCACSTTSSIPEIAGDLMTYFNPSSTDECLNAFQQLMEPKNQKLFRNKLKTYRPTTWKQTFTQLDKYIREVK